MAKIKTFAEGRDLTEWGLCGNGRDCAHKASIPDFALPRMHGKT
jgi:hypothetical protein